MTSPLMFASFQALEEFTSWYLYPHIIHFSPEENRWVAWDKKSWKLIPFYTILFLIYIGIGVMSCVFIILKYIFTNDPSITGLLVGITLFFFTASVNEWCLNVPTVNHAQEMVEYINAVIDLEETVFPHETIKPNLGKGLTCVKSTLKLLRPQLFNFIRGIRLDYMGIFQVLFAGPFQLLALLAPPMGIYFGIDPFRYGFIALGFQENPTHPPAIVIARLLMSWICVMDTFRTLALIVNPLLMEHSVYNKITKHLQQQPASHDVLRVYNYCSIIQYAGEPFVAYAISVLFGSCFVMAVLLSFTVFQGWKLLPIPLYLCSIPTTISVLGGLHIIFPLIVDSHDRSKKMLGTDWPVTLFQNGSTCQSRAILRRMIRAMKPVVFKSSWIHRPLNQETRTSYNAHIMFRTMDLMLLAES